MNADRSAVNGFPSAPLNTRVKIKIYSTVANAAQVIAIASPFARFLLGGCCC